MSKPYVSVKSLPKRERPRERLLQFGPEALSDTELLALLVGTGTRSQSVLDLARQLLQWGQGQGDGLLFLATAGAPDLAGLKGIGAAKAARLKAAVELGRRLSTAGVPDRSRVRVAADAAALVMPAMQGLEQEVFRVILLDTNLGVLAIEPVALGSLNLLVVQGREVFKGAVRRGAASMVLAHNHPSGDPTPSPQDLELTRRIVEAGWMLGIAVLDHIVVGGDRFQSMRSSAPGLWNPNPNRSMQERG